MIIEPILILSRDLADPLSFDPDWVTTIVGLLNFSTQRAAIIPISPSGIFMSLIINIFDLFFFSFSKSKLSKIFFSISFLFEFNRASSL